MQPTRDVKRVSILYFIALAGCAIMLSFWPSKDTTYDILGIITLLVLVSPVPLIIVARRRAMRLPVQPKNDPHVSDGSKDSICAPLVAMPESQSSLLEKFKLSIPICSCSVEFDASKLPTGRTTDDFLTLFFSKYSLDSLSRLRIRAGKPAEAPTCFSVVLQTDHSHNSPAEKLIGDRLVSVRDTPPISELTSVVWIRDTGSLPVIVHVDDNHAVHFANVAIETLYRRAKKGAAEKTPRISDQVQIDPRWKAVIDRFGQYISIQGSASKIPEDDKRYINIVLHTFYRDHAHADRVLSQIPDEIMDLTPAGEGLSSLSGQPRYHVTHKGNLTGKQIKVYLQSIVAGGGEIWEALL